MNESPRRTDLAALLARVVEGQSLTASDAEEAIRAIMAGEATPAQTAAFLVAMRMKGETSEEIAGAARAMRAAATPVRATRAPLVDTCGTGGDGRATWNISTAAALVAAGGGVAIAKHGNRAISSRSGSADVLESLGVRIDLDAEALGRCIDEVGIAFLFAPVLHPAMRHAIGPRREIRIRTLFNVLGPLTNPAGADRQVLGVFSSRLVPLIARVLSELGCSHALVVHGPAGEDELGVGEGNAVMEARAGHAPAPFAVDPAALGLRPASEGELRGGDAAANARWLEGLLDGSVRDASRDTVLLNAAAVFYVAGVASGMEEGCALARESVDSRAALRKLEALRRFTRDA